MGAYQKFVAERVTRNEKLWAKITKVKLLSWNASAKEITLKDSSETVILKATSTLFTRMLVIARSSEQMLTWKRCLAPMSFHLTGC